MNDLLLELKCDRLLVLLLSAAAASAGRSVAPCAFRSRNEREQASKLASGQPASTPASRHTCRQAHLSCWWLLGCQGRQLTPALGCCWHRLAQ